MFFSLGGSGLRGAFLVGPFEIFWLIGVIPILKVMLYEFDGATPPTQDEGEQSHYKRDDRQPLQGCPWLPMAGFFPLERGHCGTDFFSEG